MMAQRARDWSAQAGWDLQHARHSLEAGDFEWACFAAQQAAEKALKAVYQLANAEAWGHSVYALLENLPAAYCVEAALKDSGKELDKHYIPARYPNSYPQGAPHEYYTKAEAERAIELAKRIIRWCESLLAGSGGGEREGPRGGEGAGTPPSGN